MSTSKTDLNPFELFDEWFELAKTHEPSDVDAASIATVGPDGQPSIRIVLIREVSRDGFKFYTNLGSRKAREIEQNSRMALCFHWKSIAKQIRIEGHAELVSDAVADAYFAGRPRESQLGAWASRQSQTLASRRQLETEFNEFERQLEGQEVPRPPFWSGYLLAPNRFEFWDKREHRLHDRRNFEKVDNEWRHELLYP